MNIVVVTLSHATTMGSRAARLARARWPFPLDGAFDDDDDAAREKIRRLRARATNPSGRFPSPDPRNAIQHTHSCMSAESANVATVATHLGFELARIGS